MYPGWSGQWRSGGKCIFEGLRVKVSRYVTVRCLSAVLAPAEDAEPPHVCRPQIAGACKLHFPQSPYWRMK